jgi:hypothetical protein
VAASSAIRNVDVQQAAIQAVAALDESFFRVRIDRLTPAEKRYLRATFRITRRSSRPGASSRSCRVTERLRAGRGAAPGHGSGQGVRMSAMMPVSAPTPLKT